MTWTRVQADSRGRVQIKAKPGQSYRVIKQSDGTILLEPVVIITETELRALGINPEDVKK